MAEDLNPSTASYTIRARWENQWYVPRQRNAFRMRWRAQRPVFTEVGIFMQYDEQRFWTRAEALARAEQLNQELRDAVQQR